MEENKFVIKGVLYKKWSRHWTSDKGGKHSEGDFHYFIIEHSEQKESKREGKSSVYTKRDLIEFQLGYGLSPDDYSEGDLLEIRFSLSGKELKKKDGSPWFKTEIIAYYIKFADLDGQGNRKKEETVEYKSIKETFTPPDPDKQDDDDLSDLPFIWTILVTIGILSPFIGII